MSEQGEMEVRKKDELQSAEGTHEGSYFRPPVDIHETDEAITLMADVPGCDPDDFDINLQDNRLTIMAAKRDMGEQWEPVYEEYREGHYLREFQLGKTIDQSDISAHFDNGVLEVRLPKVDEARTRKIEIETG
jgi:HSP20 family protein